MNGKSCNFKPRFQRLIDNVMYMQSNSYYWLNLFGCYRWGTMRVEIWQTRRFLNGLGYWANILDRRGRRQTLLVAYYKTRWIDLSCAVRTQDVDRRFFRFVTVTPLTGRQNSRSKNVPLRAIKMWRNKLLGLVLWASNVISNFSVY